mgnify:CR=1 FL=1|jgi:hypothetical protein
MNKEMDKNGFKNFTEDVEILARQLSFIVPFLDCIEIVTSFYKEGYTLYRDDKHHLIKVQDFKTNVLEIIDKFASSHKNAKITMNNMIINNGEFKLVKIYFQDTVKVYLLTDIK